MIAVSDKHEQRWCNKNGIYAYLIPVNDSRGKLSPDVAIRMNVNGRVYHIDGVFRQTPYGQKQAADAIETLYKRAYEKYKENDSTN